MQIVNGYVCATSCDVAAAKKGHDPKNPHDDPAKAALLNEQRALSGAPTRDAVAAVSFGGTLANRTTRDPSAPPPTTQFIDKVA